MRTTILIDDNLGERLRSHARREGKSFSEFLANAGRKALESAETGNVEPFHLITFRGDNPISGADLDRTNELLAAEDGAIYGDHRS